MMKRSDRKQYFLAVLATAVTLTAACPPGKALVEPAAAPPDRPPEQMVIEPETGENVAGEYLQAQLENYYQERDRIFSEARRRIDSGEEPENVRAEMLAKLEDLQENTDHATKHIPQIGDVNMPELFERDRNTLDNIINSGSEY